MATRNNAAATQRQRLLAHLFVYGRISTIEARENLDVMAPAPRIYELRHKYGYLNRIITVEEIQINAQGNEHRVGVYVLLSQQGGDNA